MIPEDQQRLLGVAEWTMTSKRKTLATIRQLAGTEENYLVIVRELDRVNSQLARARTFHVEATLTLVDWLNTLNYFQWKCAYCQSQPFQTMIHHIPLPEGGTTSSNCFPACYRCRPRRGKTNLRLQAYLSGRTQTS